MMSSNLLNFANLKYGHAIDYAIANINMDYAIANIKDIFSKRIV